MMAEIESDDCLLLERSKFLVGAVSGSLSSAMKLSTLELPNEFPKILGVLRPGLAGPAMNGSASGAKSGSRVRPLRDLVICRSRRVLARARKLPGWSPPWRVMVEPGVPGDPGVSGPFMSVE